MVKHDYILFDLDGTISKSADGIKFSRKCNKTNGKTRARS